MKILFTILICMITLTASASNIIIYDEATGVIKQYRTSVNTPSFDGRKDVVVNPKLPTKTLRDLKVVAGKVVELTQEEKDARDVAEALALKEAQIASVDSFEITALDLGKALVQLGVVDGTDLKAQIKTNKGI